MKFTALISMLFLLYATAVAQSNVDVIVRSELVGMTNTVHWVTVPAEGVEQIVTVNLTNEPVPLKTNWLVQYDAPGTIQTSTDLVNWVEEQVQWTNQFGIVSTGSMKFYRAPAVPALHPTNGAIR